MGAVRPVNACAPRTGSWLMVWTPSRLRAAARAYHAAYDDLARQAHLAA